jgi:acetyltransferase-like isoleucine patch superfamily enzyme
MSAPAPDPAAAARAASAGRGSAIRAYQDLVVGSRSWLRLLAHELLGCWGAALPGALGIAFRKLTWRALLGAGGNGVAWGRNVTLRHPGRMRIGRGVTIDEGCQLDAQGCDEGGFVIGDGALISRGAIISGKNGSLAVGARANIGAGCVLYASGRLEIGADTMLAALCYIGGGHYATRGRLDVPMAQQSEPGRGVVIEEDCWLGAGVIVIDGVRIGRGSVVGAGAVVIRDVEPYSIVTGVPARVTGRRDATGPPPAAAHSSPTA